MRLSRFPVWIYLVFALALMAAIPAVETVPFGTGRLIGDVGVDGVRLDWNLAAEGGYLVERRSDGRFVEVARLPAGATGMTDPVRFGQFRWRVTALDRRGRPESRSAELVLAVEVVQRDAGGTVLRYGDTPRSDLVGATASPLAAAGLTDPAVAQANAVTLSGDYRIDALLGDALQPGFTPVSDLKFAFSTAPGTVPSEGIKANYRLIFARLAQIIPVTCTEVATGGNILIKLAPVGYGMAGPGLVMLNASYDRTGDTNGFRNPPGSHGFQALVHELGHALGLKHPFDGNIHLPPAEDTQAHTVMTYNFSANEPGTFMPYDILALQYLYGRPTAGTGGTYAFSTPWTYQRNGQTWFATTWTTRQCLWGTGADVLDFSGLAAGSYRFDLNPGGRLGTTGAVSASTFTNGTVLAYGSSFPAIVTSIGNDEVTLSSPANLIRGYVAGRTCGADRMLSGRPDDRLDLSAFPRSAVQRTRQGDDLRLDLPSGIGSITIPGFYAAGWIQVVYADSHPPVASSQDLQAIENLALPITLAASDADGDALAWTVQAPARGRLLGTAPSLIYLPPANWTGTDTVAFFVNDGKETSNTAQVSIAVRAPGVTPTVEAGPDRSTNRFTPITLSGTATDASGQALSLTWSQDSGPEKTVFTSPVGGSVTAAFTAVGTYQLRLSATNGTATASDTTTVTVVPSQNPGVVSFTAATVAVREASGRVTVTVQRTGGDHGQASISWRTVAITATEEDYMRGVGGIVSWNDQDDETQQIDLSIYDNLLVDGPRTFRFELYRPTGGVVLGSPATLLATIVDDDGVNRPPTATSASGSVVQDGSLPLVLTASDPDNDPLSWTVQAPAHGVLAGTAPHLTYTPDSGYRGTDAVVFRVSDTRAQSPSATVAITVQAVNRPPRPSAGPDRKLVLPASIVLAGGGSDPDGDSLAWSWTKVSGPSALTIASPTDPQSSATFAGAGTYRLRLAASDGTATVADEVVFITRTNTAPVANAGPDRVLSSPGAVTINGEGPDADGDPVQALWTQVSGPAAAVIDQPRQLTTSIRFPVTGIYRLVLTVADGLATTSDEVVVSVGNPGVALDTIESKGNTSLLKHPIDKKYFARPGTGTPVQISNLGQQIYEGIYSGWTLLAAENLNSENRALWRNESGHYLHIWHLNANWQWTSSEGQWNFGTAEANALEVAFQIDADGNGTIGGPVNQAPTFTTHPPNAVVTAGQTATFTVVASGTPAPTYQWQSAPATGAFTNISGATAASYTTSATTLAQSGTRFQVIATNSVSAVTSAVATLTVNPAPVGPTFTTHPGNAVVTAGHTATFAVVASGTPTPTYQWQSAPASGAFANISGATAASYTTPATTLAQNGTRFQVIATNSVSAVTSSVATLTVNPAPVGPRFTTQPVNAAVTAGQTATFTVVASGTPAPTYQWQSAPASGAFANISGATAASYTTPATTLAQNGTRFQVIATNSVSAVTSSVATLTVNPAPVGPRFTTQPVNAAVTAGQTATFTVVASGTPAPTYQWQSAPATGAFTNISGATAASYTTPATTLAQNGTRFQVIATNSVSAATSSVATLTVNVTAGANLVLNWTLDESSGTGAADASGRGNTGAVGGGATWVAGKVGGGLQFDGNSGAVVATNVGGLPSGNQPHTLAAWVKVTALPAKRAWIALLGDVGSGAHHWLINSNGVTQFGVWNENQVAPVLGVGTWKHLAVTFDGATQTGYVDGVAIGSTAATYNLKGVSLKVARAVDWENAFNGLVDDVRVYTRALTASEVSALAGATLNTGLVLNWRLDETSGGVAADSSGRSNSGVVGGGVTWTAGKLGGALQFDGVNGAVATTSLGGLPTGNQAHTLAAWVKVTALPANRAWIALLGDAGVGAHHWLIYRSGATQFGAWSSGQVTPALGVGTWKHLAVTFDGTTLTGYMNGVAIGTTAATFSLKGVSLSLARAQEGENAFKGQVDDVRVYARALTASEISALAGTTAQAAALAFTEPVNETETSTGIGGGSSGCGLGSGLALIGLAFGIALGGRRRWS